VKEVHSQSGITKQQIEELYREAELMVYVQTPTMTKVPCTDACYSAPFALPSTLCYFWELQLPLILCALSRILYDLVGAHTLRFDLGFLYCFSENSAKRAACWPCCEIKQNKSGRWRRSGVIAEMVAHEPMTGHCYK
jgi:hypothetical protein